MAPQKIKRCPFCGEKPMISRMRREIYMPKKWQLWCDNEHCYVAPYLKDFEIRYEIITIWNTRSSDE